MQCEGVCSVRMCAPCDHQSATRSAGYWRTSRTIPATPPALPSWSPWRSLPGPHRQLRRLPPDEGRGNVGGKRGHLHCGEMRGEWVRVSGVGGDGMRGE